MSSRYRMSSLSLFSAIILVVLAIMLLFTLFWGAKSSREPYQQLLAYSEMTKQVESELRGGIDHYLKSGDALVLSQAQSSLEDVIKQRLTQLPSDAVAEAGSAAQQLQLYMAGELRAAGKLSGDSQGLLLQAEREISDTLSLINDYAEKGSTKNIKLAFQYASQSAHLYELLKSLSYARERYFSSGEKTYFEQLQATISESRQLLQQLEQVPRLNLYKESDDEFALGDDEAEELLDTPLADLSSLLNRYLYEIDNTKELMQARNDSHQKTYQLLDEFEGALATLVVQIDHRSEQINALVQRVSIVIVGLFLIVVAAVQIAQYRFVGMVMRFVPHLARYAKGDLTSKIVLQSRYVEIEELRDAANQLRGQLIDIISNIHGEVEKVNQVGQRLGDAYHTIHDNSISQQQQTEQSSSAINQMQASFNEVASSAVCAADAAMKATSAVQNGDTIVIHAVANISNLSQQIALTSDLIRDLKRESENIETVLTVIESVAEQTNLLALNAAIEAARAGESGRGFAVVADEVRGLAHRTSESTQVIKENIVTLQKASLNAVNTMSDLFDLAGETANEAQSIKESFARIVSEISTIREMNSSIATATEQQVAVVADINRNIHQINTMTTQTVSAVEVTVEDSQQMTLTSMQLKNSVGRFSL